ncbi:hypothetical protein GCM10025789_31350 [Tessaracoccus lubricantis]|uniref:Phosphoadenosine phosphosulphate reductase domain-containing protein n=1 Tax=Tessaracoccus lubricantis TaxID=545543 RepID=A0ABP9FNX4_9ACTN
MSDSLPAAADPGLDLRHLAGLRRSPHNITDLIDRVAEHLDAHDGYVAFSGGKDSLVTLDLARQADPNVPVCFFDSGLEYPETLRYIADLADSWNLNIDVIPAPRNALEIFVANGTWSHHRTVSANPSLFNNIITIPASTAHARYGAGQLWGLRRQESSARRVMFAMALRQDPAGGTYRLKDGTVTFSPVWNFTDTDIWGHIARRQLPVNPVYDKLISLGAPPVAIRVASLIDTKQLENGRLVWLNRGWPSLYQSIVDALPRAAEFA